VTMSRRAVPVSEAEEAVLDSLQIDMRTRSLAGAATQALRDAIVRGQLRPGTPLRQDRLAKALGISRVPLRESLRELAGEGLVILEANKGATVSRLSLDELDELYGIVWSLEEYALHKALPVITAATIVSMQSMLAAMRHEPDPVAWYGLNVAFHRELILASRLPRILRTIDALRWNICRYVTDPVLFSRESSTWLERDGRLLDACQSRDLSAALAALGEMRDRSTSEVRHHLESIVLGAGVSVPAQSGAA